MKNYYYLIDKIQTLEIGKEYFNEETIKNFKIHSQPIGKCFNDEYVWLVCSIGKLCKLYVNQHRGGRQDNQRLNEERWERYVSVGLEDGLTKKVDQKNPKGIPSGEQDRVGVFKISSMKVTSMVSKPDFSSKTDDKVTSEEPVKKVKKKITKKKVKEEPVKVNLEDFSKNKKT